MTQAIFLSYASQDADAARRICVALRAAGLEVWFDQSELRGGDAWDASIRKQIKECSLFVPIISAHTDARPEGYFRLEWKLAVDRSHLMADNHTFFFPVILGYVAEPAALVPEKFRERQWTRLNDDVAIKAFAERIATVHNSVHSNVQAGWASSGKSASSHPSNGEVGGLSETLQPVAPDVAQRESGAQFQPQSGELPNLDPGLPLGGLRDDSFEGSAKGGQIASSDTASATGTSAKTVAPLYNHSGLRRTGAQVSLSTAPAGNVSSKPATPSRRRTIVALASIGAATAVGLAIWRPWPQSGIRGANVTLGLRPKDPQLKRAQELIDAIDGLPSEVHTAEELVKSVLATRPTDPEAVIMMSRVQNYFLTRGYDITEARFTLAKDYAERATALAPDSAFAKASLGEYLHLRGVELPRAKQLVEDAISTIPDLPRLHRLRAAIAQRSFPPDSLVACSLVEQIAAQFPNDALSQYNVGLCHWRRFEFGKATQFYERTIATGPVANAFTQLASLKLWVDGEPAQARALLERVPDKRKLEQRAVLVWYAYACLGGDTKAGLDALRALPGDWVKDLAYTGPTALLFGELHLRDAKPALAKPRFEEALAEWEKRKNDLTKSRREAWLYPYLLMRLGRQKEAQSAYRLWTDEISRPYRMAMVVNWWMESPITIGLLVGEQETALSLLREAVQMPAAKQVLQTVFKVDWRLAPFRNQPAIN
jgi:tetratricopeptide (TPR) repeat protein